MLTGTSSFKLKQLKNNWVTNFQKSFFVELVNNNRVNTSQPRRVVVAFEKAKSTASLRDTAYNNFSLRFPIYKKTKSLNFSVYIPFIAVNQTNIPIQLDIQDNPQMVRPF